MDLAQTFAFTITLSSENDLMIKNLSDKSYEDKQQENG